MHRQTKPLHWLIVGGQQIYPAVNPLWLLLRAGEIELDAVTVLGIADAGRLEACGQVLQEILAAHGAPLQVRLVADGGGAPQLFAAALASLLKECARQQQQVVLQLCDDIPAHCSALAAQAAAHQPQVEVICLLCNVPRYAGVPLALAPRAAHRLVRVEDGELRQLPIKFTGPAPVEAAAGRHGWQLPADRLMFLVNGLMDLGYDRNLSLRLPLLKNLPLCRLHFPGEQVQVGHFPARKEYTQWLQQCARPLRSAARRQIPDYSQLVEICYAAGLLKPSGLTRLSEELSVIGARGLNAGGDVYHIALDTNLLRDRFFSTCLRQMPMPANVDYVLCETVRSELFNRQGKVDDALLNDLKPLAGDLARELFFNQNQLEDRLRYVGLLEFNRMRSATGCREQDSASAPSSARNDRFILDAYSSFVEVGCKVLFLSRDQETVRMMRGEEGVAALLLEHREQPGEAFPVEWPLLCDWLYLLAVVYGRLEWVVGGTPVAVVDGVWAGKTVQQWEEDFVRVRLPRPRSPDELSEHRRLAAWIQQDATLMQAVTVTAVQ